MLGTMIIGSALGFGDIMANTVRTSVIASLGQTDEIVSARSADAPNIATLGQGTAVRYLTAEQAATVVSAALRLPGVDGAAPGISESVAVQDSTSRANEPQVTLFATDPRSMSGLGEITGESGEALDLGDLRASETFLNVDEADDLHATVGDRLLVFAAGRQSTLTVSAIVRYDGAGTDAGALLMPLASAQRILGVGTRVQHVLVSNQGDEVEAGRTSQQRSAARYRPASSSWTSGRAGQEGWPGVGGYPGSHVSLALLNVRHVHNLRWDSADLPGVRDAGRRAPR